MKKIFLVILFLILLSLPTIWFLFKPGFFQSDDGEWMIIRFSAFYQALSDGQFPIRFLSRLNHEYGYPVANFLYPGFMYIGVPIKLLGFGFVDTIKVILGTSMIASAIFVYLWLSKLFPSLQASIGVLVYLYSPYHLYDLTRRGSVGEILALAAAPFIFWQIERKSVFWSSIGIALLILSHNTLALLFLPIVILYMVLRRGFTKIKIYQYIGILVIGLLLSAFFWIPAIYDLQYTRFSQISVSDWSKYFVGHELIGLSVIVVLVLSIMMFFADRSLLKYRIALLFLVVGFLSLIFALPVSLSLWNILPVSFIQFPFRFLSLTIFSASFLAALFLSKFARRPLYVLSLFILGLFLFSSKPFFSPTQYVQRDEGFYTTNMDTTTVKNEYMPKWVMRLPKERAVKKVEASIGELTNVEVRTNRITFYTEANNTMLVTVHRVYFPGWKAKVDGKETSISYNNDRGLIMLDVPKGRHAVEVSFAETPVRLASDILSLGGFLGLIFLTVKRKKYENRG